jgi:large subunit ribosomal protein L24
MKKEFSTYWKGSRQPRKQRKYVAKAPLHIKQKMLSSHLAKELRAKYGRRAFQLRKGDTVKIMNGEHKGKTGKVTDMNVNKMRVAIENIQVTKKDGSKANLYFPPAKLMIIELNLEDKMRNDSILKTSNIKPAVEAKIVKKETKGVKK